MSCQVAISLQPIRSYLRGTLSSEIFKKVSLKLSFRVQKADYVQSFRDGKWDGRIRLFDMNDLSYPTGLTTKLLELFNELGVEYQIYDQRPVSQPIANWQWVSQEIKELRDYQMSAVQNAIQKKIGIIQVGTGGGKCISKDSICFTDSGMLSFSEMVSSPVKPGEYYPFKKSVLTPLTVNRRDSVSHLYYDGISDSKRVVTDSGFEIIGTLQHRIKVLDSDGNHVWKHLKDVKDGDFCIISRGERVFGNGNCLSVRDGYWFGLLVGNGCLTKKNLVSLHNKDAHIKSFAYEYAHSLGLNIYSDPDKRSDCGLESHIICSVDYRGKLFDLGFGFCSALEKIIPVTIRKSDEKVVAAFIRGLFETDGWVIKSGSKLNVAIQLSSKKLIKQLQAILLNFGIVSNYSEKVTKANPSYRLNMHYHDACKFDSLIGFSEDGYKNRILKNGIKELSCLQRNPNKDLVPCQGKILSRIRKKLKSKIRHIRKYFAEKCDVKYGTVCSWEKKRFPSRDYLEKYLRFLDIELPCDLDVIKIRDNLDGRYYYDRIRLVEDCSSDNFDFVVPDSKSFVANGFINHNTVIMAKFVQELSRKTLVLVHKIDLLEQARNKLIDCLGIDVGYIGNQRVEIHDVNVGTVQTIVKSLGYRYHKFMDDEVDEKVQLKEQEKEQIRHLLRTVNVVIIDESHHVRSETQQNIMQNVPIADYRIGLSATPMRDQGDDLLIEGIFGDILCKISASYLIARKFLIPPIVKFNTIDYTSFDFYEFVRVDPLGIITYCNPPPSTGKQGGRRRTIDCQWDDIAERHIDNIEVTDEDVMYEYEDGSRLVRKWSHYDGPANFVHHIHVKLEEICNAIFEDVLAEEIRRNELKFKEREDYKKWYKKMRRKYRDLLMKSKYNFIYDACITDNEYRNMMIAQMVNMHRFEGHSTLVLVRRIRHGENIQKFLGDGMVFLKGEDDIEVRNEIISEVKKKERDSLIASTIADEGLDLPALDTVIMAGGGTSKTTALQRVGRALRLFPGKTKAYIEEFYDDAQYLSKHSRDRYEIYKTEPAFEVISAAR